jgi:hypothetical protein
VNIVAIAQHSVSFSQEPGTPDSYDIHRQLRFVSSVALIAGHQLSLRPVAFNREEGLISATIASGRLSLISIQPI